MNKAVTFSIEIFPPRDAAGWNQFDQTLTRLKKLQPRFCSVTYGAGGSARRGSDIALAHVQRQTSLTPAAHLTCVALSRNETLDIARHWWAEGIRHIVALRGDMAEAGTPFHPHPAGYKYAAELVAALRDLADFEISVGCYPEIHPESHDRLADLFNLKQKLNAGAIRAISQFFFEPEVFLRFRDAAAAIGIHHPLVPGILPILDFNKAAGFARRCGASIPKWLIDRFDGLENESDARGQVAASLAVSMCERLIAEGVQNFHFYTLNRPTLTLAICHALGIQPALERAA
ncbi:methylenetetrahydrofolate reductase [NAD(P)H] [Dongia soli]|uniref:Methylenetetrahydrofolate reductase n=1 Tax=Dongia soli TaxID=600628 RepID=A0ABU5E9S8_9PROT|nr:methylenetetrahydrofolate reductase [NAD(P)H] [Dongia soli]MDY0882735.1 methylenetetrahydrofolate reductase [NAD(P)H] [Dongia soli]